MCVCAVEAMPSVAKRACEWWGWYMSAFVHVLVSLSSEWECVFVCVVAHAHRLLLFVR